MSKIKLILETNRYCKLGKERGRQVGTFRPLTYWISVPLLQSLTHCPTEWKSLNFTPIMSSIYETHIVNWWGYEWYNLCY